MKKTTKINDFCRLGISKRNSKKSQVSIQFSWIFIIIAGAIILIFFTSIIFKQKEISEQKLSASVTNQLEAIFTSSGLSSGTTNTPDTPELEIQFICDQDGYSTYFVNGIDGPENYPQVNFASEFVKGKKLITWALEFAAPFKVTNFFYVSDPDTKYVFISPNSLGQELIDDMPEEFVKQTISSLNEVDYKGYHTIKLIYFDTSPTTPLSWPTSIDTSAVRINSGTVTFYNRGSNDYLQIDQSPLPYLDIPSLYGAIFAKDKLYYECTMKKAFKKLSLVSAVYAQKESEIHSYFTTNPSQQDCSLYYHGKIDDLLTHATACNQDIESCFSELISDINAIKENQKALIQKTCPILY